MVHWYLMWYFSGKMSTLAQVGGGDHRTCRFLAFWETWTSTGGSGFTVKTPREEKDYYVNFSEDIWVFCLTYVLQHEAGQIGGAFVGINGRDVDDVIGEKLQVGQVTEPQLETRDTTAVCSLVHYSNVDLIISK